MKLSGAQTTSGLEGMGGEAFSDSKLRALERGEG